MAYREGYHARRAQTTWPKGIRMRGASPFKDGGPARCLLGLQPTFGPADNKARHLRIHGTGDVYGVPMERPARFRILD